jgi:hypothetical protein
MCQGYAQGDDLVSGELPAGWDLVADEIEEHELARKIRRASATQCGTCGRRLEYAVRRFAWHHVDRPADDHAPKPLPLEL